MFYDLKLIFIYFLMYYAYLIFYSDLPESYQPENIDKHEYTSLEEYDTKLRNIWVARRRESINKLYPDLKTYPGLEKKYSIEKFNKLIKNEEKYNDIAFFSGSYHHFLKGLLLPNNLLELYIYNFQKKIEVPKLPETLRYLGFHECGLNKLPKLPPKLNSLICSYNDITNIFQIPITLKILIMEKTPIYKIISNMLKEYDQINNQKNKLNLWNQQIDDLNPILNFYGYTRVNYINDYKRYLNYIKSVKIIENWFLKIKYDPKYAYCRRKVMESYNEMYDN